jgi:hypothetical protein
MRRSLLLVPALIAVVGGLSAAERAAPAAAPVDSGFAWTFGAHVGTPIGPAVSAAAIVGGHANRLGADGLLLMAEPGIGGGKIAIGYADIDGSASGPYLIKRWEGWTNSSTFLWAQRGWSARGVLLHTWGMPWAIDEDRTFAGAEGELIGSFATDSAWGGLYGLNLTFGVITNVDTVDHRNAGGRGDVIHPGDEWRVIVEAGVGF